MRCSLQIIFLTVHGESIGQEHQEEQIMKDTNFTDLGACYQRKNMKIKFISDYKFIINQNTNIFQSLFHTYLCELARVNGTFFLEHSWSN